MFRLGVRFRVLQTKGKTVIKFILRISLLATLIGVSHGKEKIIIDTDSAYFMDDIAAIGVVLNSQDLFDLRGITIGPGNLTPKNGKKYIFTLLDLMKQQKLPVYIGEDWPLKNNCDQIKKFATIFGGVDWIGACRPGKRKKPYIESSLKANKLHAVDFIIDEVKKNPGEITILAIGAQTNIAKALLKSPDIAKKIKRIVIMGGDAIFHGNSDKCPSTTDSTLKTKKCGIISGNASAMAEFNFFFDPEAAKIVLESDIPQKDLFGLDITNRAQVSYDEYRDIVKHQSALTKLYKWDVDAGYEKNKTRKRNIWDIIPAVYLIDSSIITDSELMYVTVVDDFSPSYGALYAHRIGYGKPGINVKKVRVMKDLDYKKFLNIFKSKMIQ